MSAPTAEDICRSCGELGDHEFCDQCGGCKGVTCRGCRDPEDQEPALRIAVPGRMLRNQPHDRA